MERVEASSLIFNQTRSLKGHKDEKKGPRWLSVKSGARAPHVTVIKRMWAELWGTECVWGAGVEGC